MNNTLQNSEERYRAIFEQAADSILLIDVESGDIIEFNDKAYENLGYTREEFAKLGIPDFEAQESPEEYRDHVDKIEKDGSEIFETKHRMKTGEIRNVLVNSKIISIGGKKVLQSIWRDITNLKRTEIALRESEKKFHSLVDLISDSVYELDEDLNYVFMSPNVKDLSGFEPEDHYGKTPFDFMPPEEAEKIFESVKETYNLRSELRNFESIAIHKDGHPIVLETSATPIFDSDGKFSGYMCIDRDITERKRAEAQLQQREAHLASILETSRDGIAVTSEDRKVVYGNTALASMYGYRNIKDLIGTSTDDYFASESYPALKQVREQLDKNEPIEGIIEFIGMRKDGTTFDAELRVASFFEEGRRLDVAAIRDVTEKKKIEFQLNQSSKLAALGELASGVAHEMNNPLAAIDVQTGLMRDILEEEGKEIESSVRKNLENCCRLVEEHVQRCQSVTEDLLSFARMPVSNQKTLQINDLLQKTVNLVTNLSEKKVDINVVLEDRLAPFKGDPDRLRQVFVNILTNAIKATEEDGWIDVETKMDNERRIVIEFQDSGIGIDPEIKDRIFDPFFTTSGEGEGSGLGLSISYYIIKQMKGDIQVDSIPGNGSIFRIILKP